jgi:transposase-like protein
MGRRVISAEFKEKAMTLVTRNGFAIIEAVRACGIGETALRRWLKDACKEACKFESPA